LVEDLLVNDAFLSSDNKEEWLRTSLATSSDMIAYIAKATVGQRDNALWSLIRKHRLTASNFGPILRAVHRNR
jgi:hypothetical protein